MTLEQLQKFYLSTRKWDGTFYNKKSLTPIWVACKILKVPTISQDIVKNEVIVWSASYSACVVYMQLCKYPPSAIHLHFSE